jgi:ethanolamine utilization protein EutA
LPLHNVPVVSIDLSRGPVEEQAVQRAIARGTERLDLGAFEGPIAIAVAWDSDPLYTTLRGMAGGVAAAHRNAARRASTIIVALTADIGASLGHILADELGVSGVIAIDGLELADLDYIDIGQRILPANVVPVVVKSLVFPETTGPRRPQILTEVR